MEGLGRMIEKYREIVQSRLVPLLLVRDHNDAEQANREAGKKPHRIVFCSLINCIGSY